MFILCVVFLFARYILGYGSYSWKKPATAVCCYSIPSGFANDQTHLCFSTLLPRVSLSRKEERFSRGFELAVYIRERGIRHARACQGKLNMYAYTGDGVYVCVQVILGLRLVQRSVADHRFGLTFGV